LGSFRLAMIGGAGLGLLPVALALPLPPWAVLAVLVAVGPFFPILMTGVFPLTTRAADDLGLSHGTANALVNMVWSGGFAITPLFMAPIAQHFGDPAAYCTAGLLVLGLMTTALAMRAKAKRMSLSH